MQAGAIQAHEACVMIWDAYLFYVLYDW
jgi:hypothetical protein